MFSKSCILDLISYGKTSGINVCISGGSVQVCSVIDGYVVKKDKIEKGLVDVMDKYYRKYCEIKRSCFDVDNDSLDNVYGSGDNIDVRNVRNDSFDVRNVDVDNNGINNVENNNNINIINDIFNKNNLIL
ncbi:actin-like protein [Vairimorpha apis BRL 01]|uniref:Actin-like protein n=1 Tax=Vairimorpha apis BRL 01 TaxID=1037528 RepID=T0L6C5_9MICR|nr:actin-like protein [Vairimorpha apis BRL 01]